jgi:dienelactone hydrolase
MGIATRTHDYYDSGVRFEAWVATPPAGAGRRQPAVLVAHTWAGRGDFECRKAEALAELGYVGVALDLYGGARRGSGPEENRAMMAPLLADRSVLRARLLAGLAAVRTLPEVDRDRVGAIGFCFGGLCALDLARSGADVRGVVSFHGLLDPPQGIELPPIRAAVLVLNGHQDPWVKPEHVVALGRELDAAGADWQLHDYGGVYHAFTNPAAQSRESGALYNARADRRSWRSLCAFLEEVLA